MTTEQDSLAPFRIRHCAKCGYDLEGLPAAHACPECGTPYSADLLELVGWSHRSFIPNRPMWWLHRVVYGVVWFLGLAVCVVIPGVAPGPFLWLVPLGYVAVTLLLMIDRRLQRGAGGNLHLLVSETDVRELEGPERFLLRRVDQGKRTLRLGRTIRRVRLRRRLGSIWELTLTSGPFRSFVAATKFMVVLRCSKDEANALAEEIRSRIARCRGQGRSDA